MSRRLFRRVSSRLYGLLGSVKSTDPEDGAQPSRLRIPQSSPRSRSSLLLICAVVACFVIEATSSVGRSAWVRTLETISENPSSGAERLRDEALLVLPTALSRAGAFPDTNLANAESEVVAAGLHRMGELQVLWLPTDPVGWLNLSRAAMIRSNRSATSRALERALALAPTSASIHRLAAVHALLSGDRASHIMHLIEANAIGQSERTPLTSLSPLEIERVRLEAQMRRVELYPLQRVQNQLRLAESLRRRGEKSAAAQVLSDAQPHPDLQLARARWDLEDGAYESALEQALDLTGRKVLPVRTRVQAWFVVAQVRKHMGDEPGALEAARETTRLDPRSPHPHLIFADIAEQSGDPEAALSHVRHAWGMSPTDTRVLLRLAKLSEETGNYRDAGLAWRRASELVPDDRSIALERIRFYIRRGDFREASALLAHATDRFPEDTRFVSLLGQSWVGIRYREAKAATRR